MGAELLVGALGSIAGSAAGNAVMGNQKSSNPLVSAVNNAAKIGINYTNMANQTLGAGLDKGLTYLDENYNEALNTLQPNVNAQFGALDKYFQLLGISTPQGGSIATYQLGQLNNQISSNKTKLQNLKAEYDSRYQEYANRWSIEENGGKKAKEIANEWMSYAPGVEKQLSELNTSIADLTKQQQKLTPDATNMVTSDPQSILENTPGYKFALNQGQRAIDQSAAAKGQLFSGATLKALDTFGQGLASTTYNNLVNQAQSALASLTGSTLQSSNTQANQGNVGTQSILNVTGQQAANTYNLGGSLASAQLALGASLSNQQAASQYGQQAGALNQAYGTAYRTGLGL